MTDYSQHKTAVVAFSGGLDTSFLVPFSRKEYGFERIITCCVDTGGFPPEEQQRIADRAKEVGADEHIYVNAEQQFYEDVLKYMIYGNVTRDGYPMCVGSERLVQASEALRICQEKGATVLLHGSTGAGNDQYRFDSVIHVSGQGEILSVAPVREFNVERADSMAFLAERGIGVSEKAKYSYNVGLWGVSIGGEETHKATGLIPEEAWTSQPDPDAKPMNITLHFEQGNLTKLESSEGSSTDPVEIIKLCGNFGTRYGIGRHYHIGTSIPGKKGRLAYESPAADMIYTAHHELEKVTLTNAQIFGKRTVSDEFGRFVHEAKIMDPYVDDLKAFLKSTQRRVSGSVELGLAPFHITHASATSPHNLLEAKGASYGETSQFYTGPEAEAAAKLHSFETRIWHAKG